MFKKRKIKKEIKLLESELEELRRRARKHQMIPSNIKKQIGQRMFEVKISLETLKKLL